MIGQTAESFVDQEVAARTSTTSNGRTGALARTLVRRAAELGLLATDVPEAYGGLELDKVSSVIVGEAVGRCASFATTFGAQTGLTITPLLCFGTEEQKQRICRGSSPARSSAPTRSANPDPARTLSARERRATRQADGSFVAQRREDVDHQRRLRRRLHRVRQGRRRPTSPPSSSNDRFPASAPARKSTSSGCSGRRRRR